MTTGADMSISVFEEFLKTEEVEFKLNEPMRNHTSFKIGGQADIFITVKNTEELTRLIKKAKELDVGFFILGKGSNLLVSDKGIGGAVISLVGINTIKICGDTVICGAGAALSEVCRAACENSLSGMEFAYGIPGSVGGALYMNAGAYGGEMSDTVVSAEYVSPSGETGVIEAADMELGYRTSIFKQTGNIITAVTLRLKKGDSASIKAEMNDFINRRKQKQPLDFPSAGSTFKRPEGYYAGALIEKNGLKGFTVGGAMVSEKHAGFVINYKNATCADVKNLIEMVRSAVFEADGVMLEPEVIFVGRD